jgi:hypothetical protein
VNGEWLGVDLRRMPKRHVLKRDWTRCSKCNKH